MRQVVLDTETTGLEPSQGHRIIEIGCVELVDRRLTGKRLQQYFRPDRMIDPGAQEVHGISNEFLADKPSFADQAEEVLAFLKGAELVIHNAPFDVGFLNHELQRLGPEWGCIEDQCSVLDSLVLARDMHPGQRNSLDALCKRYHVDNSARELHGALLDAEILAEVYLAMTGGQVSLSLDAAPADEHHQVDAAGIRRLPQDRPRLKVIQPSVDELQAHEQRLQAIDAASGGACVWLRKD